MKPTIVRWLVPEPTVPSQMPAGYCCTAEEAPPSPVLPPGSPPLPPQPASTAAKESATKGMEREKRIRGDKGMTGSEYQKNPGPGGMVPNYRYTHPVID